MEHRDIHSLLRERIVILDGAMGTQIQKYGLGEEDFRAEEFAQWPEPLKGCNDILCLTRPECIREIHMSYLEAGADIISTCSFNTNRFSLQDYALEDKVYPIAYAAAEIARKAADDFMLKNPDRECFVAGSVGPTSKTLSIASDIEHPQFRDISFQDLRDTYTTQIEGLIRGGADLILIETVFDTLNCKAALMAAADAMEHTGHELPIMVSGTVADRNGRMLSGQTIEAFCTAVSHVPLLSCGFNCGFGPKDFKPLLERLDQVSPFCISAHPNAGLPNVLGEYDETPQSFTECMEKCMEQGLVNIVGGCCGTGPEHIRALSEAARKYKPRRLKPQPQITRLSGLEPLDVTSEKNFINIGERTNVAGSAKFARLIREKAYQEALQVARLQVDAGAQIIDVCMDDGLIDSSQAMREFLNLVNADPEIARVPVMIDSSDWDTIIAGLEVTPGKGIVNSISLKEGEKAFLEKASQIRRYGAAVVVMLFDERGQATSYSRKCEVASRAYTLLAESGFPAQDIIFDPNILSVATGIREHDSYAKAFIDATRWIRQNLPLAKISGGVSNLSFAFRGNNTVREAMHSVFLYHAIGAGMDLGIVNAGMIGIYSQIEPELLRHVEDVILNTDDQAAERLIRYAQGLSQSKSSSAQTEDQWRKLTLDKRLETALERGIESFIAEDALEAFKVEGDAAKVIDRHLMPAMERVGALFGEGKMFLPQVVKSARVMKLAIESITPFMHGDSASENRPKVILATVKGDVHDIGKNIVGVVLACNGFEVEDLGVMVEPETIIERAEKSGATAINLSGLITPSLEEMRKVAALAQSRGLSTPIIIGGATTSEMHTAVRIAPQYDGAVICSANASDNVRILQRLCSDSAEEYILQVKESQQQLREQYYKTNTEFSDISGQHESAKKSNAEGSAEPRIKELVPLANTPLDRLRPYINWNFFFSAWGLKGQYPAILESEMYATEARHLLRDAEQMLQSMQQQGIIRTAGAVQILQAHSQGDDILLEKDGQTVRMPMLRNQTPGERNLCLSDFVSESSDWVGVFALSAGIGLQEYTAKLRAEGDEYRAIMAKLLCDRLTEALAEYMHEKCRREIWGYEKGEKMTLKQLIREEYMGRRMAFGYPATPDHSLKREVFDLLGRDCTEEMTLTENYMIQPGEALCGLLLSRGDYFQVGRISEAQFHQYAKRRGIDESMLRAILTLNLNHGK